MPFIKSNKIFLNRSSGITAVFFNKKGPKMVTPLKLELTKKKMKKMRLNLNSTLCAGNKLENVPK